MQDEYLRLPKMKQEEFAKEESLKKIGDLKNERKQTIV